MASHSGNALTSRDIVLGVTFALLAAVGFSAKAILVKLAYLDQRGCNHAAGAAHGVFDAILYRRNGLGPAAPCRAAQYA